MSRKAFFVLIAAMALLAAYPARAVATPALVAGGGADSTGTYTAGGEGAVFEASGGATISLAPEAGVQFLYVTELALSKSGPPAKAQVIRVRSGRVTIDVPQRHPQDAAVVVYTKWPIRATAKAGRSLIVADDSRVTFATLQGGLQIDHDSHWTVLSEGRALTVREDNLRGEQHDFPTEAPAVSVEAPLVLSVNGAGASVRLTWRSVRGAHAYEYQIVQRSKTTRRVVSEGSTREPSVRLPSLDPGSYGLTVRARDRHGLWSPPSEETRFRVVGLSLPEQSFVTASGSVAIDAGDRPRLTGAHDLEMTYGARATYFFEAPESVGLNRGTGVLVRLRAPETGDELPFRLERRTLHAEIALDPASVVVDPQHVGLRVRVLDRLGHPVPTGVPVDIAVEHGIDTIDATWHRQGPDFVAEIDRPTWRGPWSFTVRVRDASGKHIASAEVHGSNTSKIVRRQPLDPELEVGRASHSSAMAR